MSIYTVIVRTEGCVHTYNNLIDTSAQLLFTAMCVYVSGSVEIWRGDTRIAFTENDAVTFG